MVRRRRDASSFESRRSAYRFCRPASLAPATPPYPLAGTPSAPHLPHKSHAVERHYSAVGSSGTRQSCLVLFINCSDAHHCSTAPPDRRAPYIIHGYKFGGDPRSADNEREQADVDHRSDALRNARVAKVLDHGHPLGHLHVCAARPYARREGSGEGFVAARSLHSTVHPQVSSKFNQDARYEHGNAANCQKFPDSRQHPVKGHMQHSRAPAIDSASAAAPNASNTIKLWNPFTGRHTVVTNYDGETARDHSGSVTVVRSSGTPNSTGG